ncbi:ABC transporter permease [Ensifer sp. 1H6]|uniref:ABC transporter permease n=1 Tax=Ensifer sp. 1H6 TaxID=1911585 RepID=UPI0009CDB822|nr:ABC transporter permease [Ensifer sp. 1H6]OMQ46698.1 amino acid ABC transporter permease [Ensifer sp. 1H6]
MIEILQEYWKAYLLTDGYRITGVAMTLWLLVASIVLGFVLAIPLSVARASANPYIRVPVWLYTYVFRGTPLYVQLLILYTGFYSFSFVRSVPLLDSFFREGINCAILAFALCTCAYTTEIFAGAIRAVPHGEIEAARAYGMSAFTVYRRIVLPSALRRALPAYSNEVILVLHATSIAFTATVPDVLKVARDVNSATYASFEAFGIAAVLYASIAFTLVWLFRQLEGRLLAFARPHTGLSGVGQTLV